MFHRKQRRRAWAGAPTSPGSTPHLLPLAVLVAVRLREGVPLSEPRSDPDRDSVLRLSECEAVGLCDGENRRDGDGLRDRVVDTDALRDCDGVCTAEAEREVVMEDAEALSVGHVEPVGVRVAVRAGLRVRECV